MLSMIFDDLDVCSTLSIEESNFGKRTISEHDLLAERQSFLLG